MKIDNEGFKIPQGITHRKMENEWRCYLIYLKNAEHKEITLTQMARKLVMELEPKITEVELIRDLE